MNLLHRVAALLAAFTVAGCTTTVVSGHGTSAPGPPTSSASSSSSSPPPDRLVQVTQTQWTRAVDPESRISFALPLTPTVSKQVRSGLAERQYSASYGNNLEIGVAVIDANAHAVARAIFSGYPDAIDTQFRSVPQSPKDFAITERRFGTTHGHRTLDFRISFTPVGDPGQFTVWFIRLVLAGTRVVLLQTISGAPKFDLVRYVRETRALHARLVRGVRI